jgi:hypothetical protein
MIYTFKSSREVIAKLFRDLKLQDAHWIADGIEWIGEALEAIGSTAQTVQQSKVAKSSSFKVPLPANLAILEEVRYGRYNSTKTADNPPKLEDFTEVMAREPGGGAHPALLDNYNSRKGANLTIDETFFIKGGMVHVSFEEDWVAFIYKSFAVDEDGYPMVPDHYSYSQALYWYIVMKMIEGGFKHPAGVNQINWAVAEDRWQYYCGQARNQSKMPDASTYRRFMKSWVTLIPDYSEVDIRTLGIDYESPEKLAGMAYRPIKDE